MNFEFHIPSYQFRVLYIPYIMLLAPIAIAFYAAFYAGAALWNLCRRILCKLKFSMRAHSIELKSYEVIMVHMADTSSLRPSWQGFDEKEGSLVV